MTATGCNWIVGRVKRWNSTEKKYEMAPVFCHKVTEANSDVCPRHKSFRDATEPKPPMAYTEGR